ncbi:glycosyl transferase family 2 [Planktotalea frisia]|jgi:teichuronic acid biosynthesis glycosyltransferase TuaG|uniref:UDP-Glc:alpha-D-GlcNAc-diphosphoundecaprenol beta-1,3-glucosyltransferase WfgD n=1 Tax=Planktotalea frisia TaxID=696762 RepID=A0A1L9NT11_9RHOB|nr:glycosyltransferase family A protein [Planktotalea frisia]OJI92450.1 UDP-Glc:alpha-D-GlcNAc-diphosphoundecaprenol beta-1,3-glucosyltransferase WfgD [Planktotalea frisia]PZX23554.1 glycosyl transferase family 2 [Planktotalea frisia]
MATVSILMPAYRAAPTIGAAIASIQAQTEPDWELLVINDRSQDETVQTALEFAQEDDRIRILDNDGPKGAAAARNAGLAHATGRYIAFLDADDEWLPNKLASQLALLLETNAPLCYTGFEVKRAKRHIRDVRVPTSVTYEQLLAGNIIGCLTAMYDTQICGKVTMPLIKRRHDFALWLHILKAHGPACGIPEPHAILRLANGTLSSNKILATYGTWRMYRDIVGLSIPKSMVSLYRHLRQRILR